MSSKMLPFLTYPSMSQIHLITFKVNSYEYKENMIIFTMEIPSLIPLNEVNYEAPSLNFHKNIIHFFGCNRIHFLPPFLKLLFVKYEYIALSDETN